MRVILQALDFKDSALVFPKKRGITNAFSIGDFSHALVY
jgi:hypothetical protein